MPRYAASILAALTAISLWLSAGTIAVAGGDTSRIAALPPFWLLLSLIVVAVIASAITRLQLREAWPLSISFLLWLPFIPARVPAAFLIWQGPLEWLVWLLVIAGLIAAQPRLMSRLSVAPVNAPAVVAIVVALASLVVFARVRDVIPGGDEPHYLAATQSLLKDVDLKVANNYAAGDYLSYFPGRLEPHFLTRSKTGEIYSIHAAGISVIVLPAFAMAGYVGAVLMMIAFAAMTAALTWRIAMRVVERSSAAWLATLAVFFTAPYFFHTFTIYPEIIGSFCVMCGVWLLLDLDDGREPSDWMLVTIGAALAALPWLHSRFVVIALVFGVAIAARLAVRANGWSRVLKFGAVPAIAAVWWFALFWMIWGSPSPTAPYGADTSTSPSYVLRGLIGLLIDQQFGVLTTAPVYIAAVAGFIPFARKRPRLAAELATVVIVYAIAVASYAMWWAGSAAPARFLVAILPIAALPMAFAANSVSAIALLISIALIIPRAFVESGRLIFNGRGVFDPTIEWLSPVVDLTMALPSVHRSGGSIALRDAAIWIVLLALAVAAIALRVRKATARWTIASLTLAGASMIAATIVWFGHGDAVRVSRSKLAAFAEYQPWLHRVVYDIGGTARGSDFLSALSVDVPAGQRIDRLPAGEYEMTSAQPAALFVGRNDPAIETINAGASTRIRFPVALQTLNIKGTDLLLRPVAAVAAATRRSAVRASRYGSARVFFFDEHAYPEPDGFWTRADSDATVVIDTAEPPRSSSLPITVTAGAVATAIHISTSGFDQLLSLNAGQTQQITLPPTTGNVWTVSIRSGSGFRPSEREPGSRDVRLLAAWITLLR